jgi:prevent-host-death family protein
MKTVAMRDLQKQLKAAVETAQTEQVIITRHGKPFAVCIGIEGYDWEDVFWMTNAAFWRMIHDSRQQPTMSREELDAELGTARQRGTKKSTAAVKA